MFKKPIKIGAQNQLSGKDKKAIKNKLVMAFDENCVEKLFNNNDKIICNKVSGSKMLIYSGDEYPLLVDGTGKQNFFPSLYVCAAYEPLLKSITINEGVQTFIFNGANLMWPGVRDFNGLGNFKKDEVIRILSGKGEVVAIGAMGCSLDELKSNSDGSGIAVYILHYRGDKLWEMGNKVYPEVIIKYVVQKKEEQKPQIKKQETIQQKKVEKRIDKKEEKEQEKEVEVKGKKEKKNKNTKQIQNEKDQTQVINKKQKQQKKQTIKQPPKKKESSDEQESDGEVDFGNLIHSKQKNQKVEPKKVVTFIEEDQIGKKNKNKKAGKKGGKKAESQDEQQKNEPQKKQNKKNKKHESDDEQQEQNDRKQNKNKSKKQTKKQSEEEDERPKGKNNNKNKKMDDQDAQQEQVKPQQKKKNEKKDKKKKEQSSEEEKVQKQKKEDDENQEGTKSVINNQLMDEYFKEAFLNVLKLSKVEGQFPIDSGRFYMDYMLLARSEGVKLEIKDTTYKKLGKFFQQMSKKKIIQFKPAKQKKGQQGSTITKIFWQNQQLKNYIPTIKKLAEKDVEEKEQEFTKYKLKLSKTIQIQYVYKPNQELKKILFKKVVNYMPQKSEDEQTEQKQKKDIFLSEKELKQKIEKYINEIAKKQGKQAKQTKESKEGKDDRRLDKLVTLDYKQNPFIFNLLKQEIQEYEDNLQKQQIMNQPDSDEEDKKKKKDKGKKSYFKVERGFLVNKIMKLASSHYNMIDKENNVSKFKEGVFKGIQLIADKIINKNVTKIIGIQLFAPANVEPEELVKQIHGFSQNLQIRFASSSSVQNLPGKNAGRQIILQGNFIDELQTIFTSEYGIKKEYITIQNKLGKKKK